MADPAIPAGMCELCQGSGVISIAGHDTGCDRCATPRQQPAPGEGFAPWSTCQQYSHSIGEDALTKAFMHFQSMITHPVRGHPMGNAFDEQTRDAAQVLMAATCKGADQPAAPGGWRDIASHVGHGAVLVSRPTDRLAYSATTAFFDATNVWRVFRSEGGMTPLPFAPTHWMPLPAAPAQADREG